MVKSLGWELQICISHIQTHMHKHKTLERTFTYKDAFVRLHLNTLLQTEVQDPALLYKGWEPETWLPSSLSAASHGPGGGPNQGRQLTVAALEGALRQPLVIAGAGEGFGGGSVQEDGAGLACHGTAQVAAVSRADRAGTRQGG